MKVAEENDENEMTLLKYFYDNFLQSQLGAYHSPLVCNNFVTPIISYQDACICKYSVTLANVSTQI